MDFRVTPNAPAQPVAPPPPPPPPPPAEAAAPPAPPVAVPAPAGDANAVAGDLAQAMAAPTTGAVPTAPGAPGAPAGDMAAQFKAMMEGAFATTHTVQKGDTLGGIAKKVLGDANRWPEIAALNQDVVKDPNKIMPGQVLKLPGAPAGGAAPAAVPATNVVQALELQPKLPAGVTVSATADGLAFAKDGQPFMTASKASGQWTVAGPNGQAMKVLPETLPTLKALLAGDAKPVSAAPPAPAPTPTPPAPPAPAPVPGPSGGAAPGPAGGTAPAPSPTPAPAPTPAPSPTPAPTPAPSPRPAPGPSGGPSPAPAPAPAPASAPAPAPAPGPSGGPAPAGGGAEAPAGGAAPGATPYEAAAGQLQGKLPPGVTVQASEQGLTFMKDGQPMMTASAANGQWSVAGPGGQPIQPSMEALGVLQALLATPPAADAAQAPAGGAGKPEGGGKGGAGKADGKDKPGGAGKAEGKDKAGKADGAAKHDPAKRYERLAGELGDLPPGVTAKPGPDGVKFMKDGKPVGSATREHGKWTLEDGAGADGEAVGKVLGKHDEARAARRAEREKA